MWAWVRGRLTSRHAPSHPVCAGTLVDACDVDSVMRLVRVHERGDGADGLLQRLTRTFSTFRPTDRVMQRLSLFQQALQGMGNDEEYCVVTAHCAAIVALCQEQEHARPITRTRSLRLDGP